MSMPSVPYDLIRQMTDEQMMEEFLSDPGGGRAGPVDRRFRRTRRPVRDPLGIADVLGRGR